MSSHRPSGMLLVLSAPSGAGKTTLARSFLEVCADAFFSVSVTTRAPRGVERDGVDYHFVSPERFDALVAEGVFAEWAEVHGHRYGTLRKTVEDALAGGRVAIFDIDVQGGERVKGLWPDECVTVFVLPPSMGELERRLRARSTDSDEAIVRRLAVARAETNRGLIRYEYVIVNDDLEKARGELAAVVEHERARLGGATSSVSSSLAESVRCENLDLARWIA